MNVLARYVIGVILRNVALVLAVLVSVSSLFVFVSQLDDIGVANFGLREAILFVALRVPRGVVESLPAATLLGSLLGLGHLATQSELIAMRAAGISRLQLLLTVGFAGLLLSALMVTLGESIAPSLGSYAREMRGEALLNEVELANGRSTWFKDDDVVVNVRRGFGGDRAGGVYLYEFSDTSDIAAVARADSVASEGDSNWTLSGYAETRFSEDRLSASNSSRGVHELGFNAELLGLSEVRHDLLDTPALQRYIAYLEANGRDTRRYLIAYWSRWASAVSVPLMALLAVPFVFGSLRTVGSGARLVVGLCIGLGFYVADQVLTNSGAVFEFDPLWVAWTPTLGLLLVVTVAAARSR